MGGWPGGRVGGRVAGWVAGWPGGWLEKVELRLFSTQVEAVVDLKLELSLAKVAKQGQAGSKMADFLHAYIFMR